MSPKYSQVFLKDRAMCERIARALGPDGFKRAVEIGPGRGALTEFLAPLWGERLSAVEIDPLLAVRIKEGFPGVRVLNSDFLALDLGTLGEPGSTAFVGNLPYECSTAILLKVLGSDIFGGAVFMFQLEVARKIAAPVGGHDYGYLSVAAQAQSEISLLSDVPAESFSPVPEVDSSVLSFRPLRRFPEGETRASFLAFVKNAFSHRRKTLANSLAFGTGLLKSEVEGRLRDAGFDPRLRPQNLSVEDYISLASMFSRPGRP
ncbi:MAG TPA: 16S rRNA (adenine(1518)-N(6)/adenine(1519)-N(6))-dimethyltransferase RsmA [Elusimicrobiales bacterium]|nr:16S rRNA (adenine(1518)-N(6)/adenine(1519)-N(6))-dimethyltransferase RsmA [Elusimicrobiales bacterium]